MPQNHWEMTPKYGEMIPNYGEMTQNLWGHDSKLWGNEAKYYGESPQRQSEYTPVIHFLNRQDVSFHMVVPWIYVAVAKSQSICRNAKNCHFWHFFVSSW